MEKNRTTNDFIAAFWALYDVKPLEKISVRELCQTAGYNRTTFYAHFSDIYDLLDQAVDNLIFHPIDDLHQIHNLSSLIEHQGIARIFLNFLKANRGQISLLMKHHDDYLLAEKIRIFVVSVLKDKMSDQADADHCLEYLVQYQISGIFGLLKLWYQEEDGLNESKLAELLFEVSTTGIFAAVQKRVHSSDSSEGENDAEIIESIIENIQHREE